MSGTALVVAIALPGFLTASLAPRIRADFPFGDSALGLTVSVFYAVSAASSTPSGVLVDRIGALRGARLAAGMTAASCLAVAGLAHSALALIGLLMVAGLGNGMGGPAVSALLKHAVVGHRHGLAFGAQQSGASLSALLAGLALPALAIPFGWRWAFVAGAALAATAAAAMPAHRAVTTPASAPRSRRGGLGAVHALALAAGFASAAGVGFVAFLVLYGVHSGMSESAAGLLLGAVSLVATVARVGLGALADRDGSDPLRPTAAMLAASVCGYLLLIAGEPGLVAAGALMVGALGWAWPGALTLAVVQRSPEAPAWAVGVMMTGLFVGAVTGPLVIGQLAEHGVYAGAWGACAGLALLSAATVEATRRASS